MESAWLKENAEKIFRMSSGSRSNTFSPAFTASISLRRELWGGGRAAECADTPRQVEEEQASDWSHLEGKTVAVFGRLGDVEEAEGIKKDGLD